MDAAEGHPMGARLGGVGWCELSPLWVLLRGTQWARGLASLSCVRLGCPRRVCCSVAPAMHAVSVAAAPPPPPAQWTKRG
eukprot:312756-Chlamydomonas_euryale.AAC.1